MFIELKYHLINPQNLLIINLTFLTVITTYLIKQRRLRVDHAVAAYDTTRALLRSV